MPFKIIREDITKVECDAIVNPTNEKLKPSGGVDFAIHEGAGTELFEMCQELGGLKVGRAKITPAYNLSCKYIIHTVGPRWRGGNKKEKEDLQSCYREALKIAKGTKCQSVAFPLISSGLYGYPKDQVLTVALEVIKQFLSENDMLIYLVVYDKTSYALSEALALGVEAYIDDNYLYAHDRMEGVRECRITPERRALFTERQSMRSIDRSFELNTDDNFDIEYMEIESRSLEDSIPRGRSDESQEDELPFKDNSYVPEFGSVNSIKKFMQEGFRETLFSYIDKKGVSDVECYKRANVSRQTWHKIVADKYYKPKKNTAIALAISLQLSIDETQALLATAGFILSKSSLFDVIIMFCLVKGIYDVFEIDSILFQYDQETLFSKE